MNAQKGNIYEILNGNRQFLIPVYQRYYSWGLDQCERLWNDIVNMQKHEKTGHFVGSIVNIAEQAMPTGVQKYMIIDGQQRMTTLTLLLIALRDYRIEHPEDMSINAERIDHTLLKNAFEAGDERYKLILTETDKADLISLIERKPFNASETSKIVSNYNYFVNQINSMRLTPVEIYEAIGKLQIVNITLDRTMDDPQAIFESLNSTGKALSESDLIRNYVLMGLDNKEQTYVYENIWRSMELLFRHEKQDVEMDRFFRDYLTMKQTKIPKINGIYDEFKQYHSNYKFELSIRDLCQDLYAFASYYTDIVFCRSKDAAIAAIYKDINSLRMEVAYPFLLKVHSDAANNLITNEELKEIMKLCVSYIFRRNICDIPPNSLNKTFATLRNEIKDTDYLNSVKAAFTLMEGFKVFPNDERFSTALSSKDVYNMRSRNYMLSNLENSGNKMPIIIDNYSIEHIMPQNSNLCAEWQASLGANWKEIQKKYLHTIGNLTLTAPEYNSAMSDRPFSEKMDIAGGFKQSALRINAYVVLQTEWNEKTIQERAKILTESATQIWRYPQLGDDEVAPYLSVDKATPKYNINSYDINAFTNMLFEALDKRIRNLSPDVRREFKKLYIAYKLDTNFVDVVVQKKRLRISVNMNFSEVHDPLGICRDITNLGRWGNGNVELFFEHLSDLDMVMDIVKQSYDLQAY